MLNKYFNLKDVTRAKEAIKYKQTNYQGDLVRYVCDTLESLEQLMLAEESNCDEASMEVRYSTEGYTLLKPVDCLQLGQPFSALIFEEGFEPIYALLRVVYDGTKEILLLNMLTDTILRINDEDTTIYFKPFD